MFTMSEENHIVGVKKKLRKHLVPFKQYVEKTVLKSRMDQFYLSGGAIASLIQNHEPRDLDIWCRNKKSMDILLDYITTFDPVMVMDVNSKYREKVGKDGKLITENATTIKCGDVAVQLITKNYGEPKVITDTFDFLHCTPHYDIAADKLYISERQYFACKNKLLLPANANIIYNGEREPKFLERGYKRYEEEIEYEYVEDVLDEG